MGLFDRILRQGAKALTRAASEVIENVADDILNNESSDGTVVNAGTATTRSTAACSAAPVNVPAGYENLVNAEVDEKLRVILEREFPQYEVKEQVSPTTIGGTGKFRDYDFAVYENGTPKLFIMVVYSNTCASREYRWSKEEAAKAGVTMINFVYCFENKIDYIINRLHQYL